MADSKRINISDLAPGMELAKDVASRKGRLLLERGTVVNDVHLRTFNIWGVTEVFIKGPSGENEEPESPGTGDPGVDDQVRAQAERMLRLQPPGSELTEQLMRIAVSEQARLSGQGPESDPVALPPMPTEPVVPPLDDLDFGEGVLVSSPDVYFRIVKVLEDPASSAGHLADVISKDTTLSAKLLKLVNSPLYGYGGRIDSLTRGVALLGNRAVTELALGVSVVDMFRDVPAGIINSRTFWEHSLACAVLAKNLAAQTERLSPERCFVAGILHDVGRLALLRLVPEAMTAALLLSQEQSLPLFEAELKIMGYDHVQAADRLFGMWGLSGDYCAVVVAHHDPTSGQAPPEAAAVHLGDVLANTLGAHSGGSPLVPPVSEAAWNRLGIPLGALEVCVAQARRQIMDIVDILLGTPKEKR